jgi:prolyl-tRNA synthetase
MFSEMDLMGFPHRLVIGERGLKSGTIEYRNRRSGVTNDYPLDEVVQALEALREL